MAEIVNLNCARKDKARASEAAKAAENRIAFGRTKAEKQKAATEKRIADKIVDAHKREPD